MQQLVTKKMAVLAYPGANSLDVTGPLQVFASASRYNSHFAHSEGLSCDIRYSAEVIAPEKGPVRLSPGFDVIASASIYDNLENIDTLLVAGGDGFRELILDERLLARLGSVTKEVKRFGSVCTGAFLLGAAGILNNCQATTHWRYCREFQDTFPQIQVDDDSIYIKSNGVYTSGGVTAGIDLALAMVEEDCGSRNALAAAREIVACKVRAGGQSQYSTRLDIPDSRNSSLSNLLQWVSANLDQDLSVEALAGQVAMSPRNFARVFVRETGITPAKYVEHARLEAARIMLEEMRISLTEVAGHCGFGHPETMRRVFLRHLKVSPREYQDRFRISPEGADSNGLVQSF